MKRFPDWTSRLTAFIKEKQSTPFEWGVNDCCLLAADAVQAITGDDPAAAFRNRYTTRLGAARVLKNDGFNTLEDAITAQLGQPVPRLQARRGDVVLIEYDGELTTGVMFGTVLVPGLTKLESVSPLDIKKVWRVG